MSVRRAQGRIPAAAGAARPHSIRRRDNAGSARTASNRFPADAESAKRATTCRESSAASASPPCFFRAAAS
ncbi:MAG: hypothetical protein HPZ91_00295 [Lentisphaeria bacterium]|nr:hypothetical protein [Lentisphaeria bacterium]